MSTDSELQARTRVSGQIVFVGAALLMSLALLVQIPTQTTWIEDAKSFAAQPRFWPGVAIVTMVVTFGLHLWLMKRRRPIGADWGEAKRWLEPMEYAVWFMVYVFAVPWIGFLPMSIAFATALTWRLGYRTPLYLWLAVVFAVGTVLLFKGFLGVKIPGAALYELLPDALRSFALQYL